METHKGRSQDATSPFVPAKFWKEGTSISGQVESVFDVRGKTCYAVTLVNPIEIDGEETREVSLGSAGVGLAVRAAKCGLKMGDRLTLTCNGFKDTGQESKMVMFDIEIEREDADSL